ncbi:GCN5-related N-acetyltransferase [Candidatus Magnetomorum sp. HK-1]|nr:GCN5-related N-acetyltransferase [Candidatus Magnetomorum sp. HK-1]
MNTKINIYEKRLNSLTDQERATVKQLTLSENSYMSFVLKENVSKAMCWLAISNNEKSQTCIQNIPGWSLLRWFTPDIRSENYAYISIFVQACFRKQGIGKRLIGETIAYANNNNLIPVFYGESKMQKKFYNTCNISLSQITSHAFPRIYWEHYKFVKTTIKGNNQ